MAYKYVNGKWVYTPSTSSSGGREDRPSVNTGGSSSSISTPPNLTDTSNRDTTESTNEANKEYIEIEDDILTGELRVLPNPYRKAKATVLLQYLGNNLTGLYFVDRVTHSFSSNGYEQTLTVSRNGFGSTIKSGSASKPVSSVAPTRGGLTNSSSDNARPGQTVAPKVVKPKVEVRYYTIARGDTLWGIAKKFYGNGAQYPKIYNANRNIISNPNLIYPGQKIKIP